MSSGTGVAHIGRSTCWGCGRDVAHRPGGGGMRRHACALRLVARIKWRAHLAGWHSGYRFALENYDDDMVQADLYDYGSGWAGYMRTGGGIRININPPEGDPS